ncbi:MAG: type II secretion system F family protein [Pseudomonadota bacterium]
MDVNRWSRRRQWQWVEDYCHWLQDGCSPLQAAKAMQLSAEEYELQREQQLAQRLYHCLRRGLPLITGLQGWLDRELLQVFALGQQSHCLTELLTHYQQFQHQRRQLILKLWRQRLYPLFVLLAVLAATAVAGSSYFPRLLKHVEQVPAGWAVVTVVQLGELLMRWGWIAVVSGIGLFGLYRWLGQNWISAQRFKVEHCGLFGYQRALTAVWITQMVALMLRHRLSLQDTLQRLQPMSSRYAQYHLRCMSQRLARGEQQLAEVMSTGLLTPQLLFRLRNSGRQQAVLEGLWRTALRSSESIERGLMLRQRIMLAALYSTIIILIVILIQASGQLMMAILMS